MLLFCSIYNCDIMLVFSPVLLAVGTSTPSPSGILDVFCYFQNPTSLLMPLCSHILLCRSVQKFSTICNCCLIMPTKCNAFRCWRMQCALITGLRISPLFQIFIYLFCPIYKIICTDCNLPSSLQDSLSLTVIMFHRSVFTLSCTCIIHCCFHLCSFIFKGIIHILICFCHNKCFDQTCRV